MSNLCRICNAERPKCRAQACSDACWRKLEAMQDNAPELLAALERLLLCPALNMDENEVEDVQASVQARKAIARAKGGAA